MIGFSCLHQVSMRQKVTVIILLGNSNGWSSFWFGWTPTNRAIPLGATRRKTFSNWFLGQPRFVWTVLNNLANRNKLKLKQFFPISAVNQYFGILDRNSSERLG